MKVLMFLAVCLFASGLLLAQNAKVFYSGQSELINNKEARVRMPASVDGMQKYYRFFDSKEDNYKNLYY